MLFLSMFFSQITYKQKSQRKERHFLPAKEYQKKTAERAFSGLSASMTLEAACVLPWFLFAMLAVMQFFKIVTVSSALLAGMQDTAKDMAVYAYVQELGVTAGEGVPADLITGGLSAAYAKSAVERKAAFTKEDGTLRLWQSSFLQDQIIDLAITYRAKNTYTLLPIPGVGASLRARVRAWTGRDGNGAASAQGDGQEEEMVFITETGTVYHRDANCTHIKLSIQRVDRDRVGNLRNESGARYHACERCGGGRGDVVYITEYGNRYHSSVSCSGLKRTVSRVPLSEVQNRRACSKCGGS